MDSVIEACPISPMSLEIGQPQSSANEIIVLRTQIKGRSPPPHSCYGHVARLTRPSPANAVLLFSVARAPGASNHISEIGLMRSSLGEQKEQHGYTAILTALTGFDRFWSIAAKRDRRGSIVAALRSLLDVTAAGREKFQRKILKTPNSPPARSPDD